MRNFEYIQASTPEEAASLISTGSARIIAGGTDVLPLMKEDLAEPDTLVDISRWREGRNITDHEGGLRIGALVTLSDLASNPNVRERYAALAEACSLSAAPQLRNMGTIGGNLMQATRCWYYRGPFDCWLKGGSTCFARNGENELHSIFHTTPQESMCVSASPSDPATALLALDATISYQSASGSGELPFSEFLTLPTVENRRTVSLPENAIITSINLPPFAGKSTYHTVMSRATWTFALAGVAIVYDIEGGTIAGARVSLGGVAPIPIQISAVESRMNGQTPSSLNVDDLAQMLVSAAQPLSQNGYKVPLLTGLFKETLQSLI